MRASKFKRRSLSKQQSKYATPEASYRSGLEEKVAQQIAEAGHTVRFETQKIAYVVPAKEHSYLPDFILDNGIIIETKGLFTREDRAKHKFVKGQHPELDIRIVFSNAFAKIAKGSKTTYAKFCETVGIKWAHKWIPTEWLAEAIPC